MTYPAVKVTYSLNLSTLGVILIAISSVTTVSSQSQYLSHFTLN